MVVTAACVSGRRSVAPVAAELIDAPPHTAFLFARQALVDEGLSLTQSDPEQGVLETAYLDIASFRPEAAQYPAAERAVRFRILLAADPDGPGTRLLFQAVYDPFNTGLANTRRNERPIPEDHPAMDLVRTVIRRIQRLAEGG